MIFLKASQFDDAKVAQAVTATSMRTGGATTFSHDLPDAALPTDSPVRNNRAYARLRRLQSLKNIHLIEGAAALSGGDHDFSAYGVRQRYEAGRAATVMFPPNAMQPPQLLAERGAKPAAA